MKRQRELRKAEKAAAKRAKRRAAGKGGPAHDGAEARDPNTPRLEGPGDAVRDPPAADHLPRHR